MLRFSSLCACVLLAACSGDQASTATKVDSAGIQIVLNRSAASSAWQLAAKPAVEIGVLDGPEELQFSAIVSAFQLDDGTIVAAHQRNPPQLRLFDANGRYLRSIGRVGSGPGEFRLIFFADHQHDTLRVYDPMNARISYFNPQGDLLATHQINASTENMAAMFILFPGLSDGGFLGRSNAPRSGAQTAGKHPGASTLVLADRSGVVRDTIGEIEDGEFEASNSGGQGLVHYSARAATLAHDTLIYVGSGRDYNIDVYDRNGRMVRKIRREVTARSITPADIDALVQKQLAAQQTPQGRQRLQKSLQGRSAAAHMPAYDMTFRVDHDDNLWVKGYAAPHDTAQAWSVFARDGVYLGDVTVPETFRILEIGIRGAVGVFRDSLDVEHLRVWPLVKK